MKKIFLAAALLGTFSVQAQNAQTTKKLSPQERAERHSNMMEKKLNLNAEQSAAIRKIDAETAEKIAVPVAHRREDRALIEQLNANREAEYVRILTPEQASSYEQLKTDRKAHMKARKANANFKTSNSEMIQRQPDAVR